ncbi:MAG: O-antigen ligase family protein, partial [Planctomycetota bacterium]
MTPPAARQPVDTGDGRRRGTVLRNVAFAILVAILASRVFLSELPYRTAAFPSGSTSLSAASAAVDRQAGNLLLADRTEAARVTFALGLLFATALWLLAGAVDRRLDVRRGHLLWLIGTFAVVSLASAIGASDKRTALDVWLEQVSLLSAGFLTVQLCADRRRFAAVVIVLAALAVAMVVKGYYQLFVEIPDRIADFEAHKVRRLAKMGIESGTARARLFEARLRDTSPTGFFSLANVFASLLVVLMVVGAGLAVDKFRAAARSDGSGRKGEINVALLAGFLALAVAAAVVPVWLLTRSMGATGSGTIVLAGGTLAFVLRNRLSRHWRKAVVVVAGLWLVASAVVVGYGLARDRLPTKTMTFRWYYWTASAEIVREEPLLGAGPGNFPDAYLRHRRAAAEEAVKNPHNAVVHAFSEHGLIGGALYLAVPVVMLIGASRPRGSAAEEQRKSAGSELSARWAVVIACMVTIAVFASRSVFSEARADVLLLVLDALLPALVLLGGLAIMSLGRRGVAGSLEVPAACSRIALVAAAVGFV